MNKVTARVIFMFLGSLASIPLGISTAFVGVELYSGRNDYAILYFIPVLVFIWLVLIWVSFFILQRKGVSFKKANNVLGFVVLASLFHLGIPEEPPGLNARMTVLNRSERDIGDVLVSVANWEIIRRRVEYAGYGDGRGVPYDGGSRLLEIPDDVVVAWNELEYKDNELILLPRHELSIEILGRIPEDIVRKATGWDRGRLMITLNILDDQVALLWALWPSREDHGGYSDGPLAFGGDQVPAESLERQLYFNLFREYRKGPEQARIHLEKAVSNNVDLNKYSQGKPILWYVLSYPGYGWYARMLLEKGADPNLVAMDTRVSPLMLAAGEGDVTLVDDLMSRHAEINRKNINGDTALTYAAHAGHTEVVALLLGAGADKAANDYAALHGARSQGFHGVVKLLQD